MKREFRPFDQQRSRSSSMLTRALQNARVPPHVDTVPVTPSRPRADVWSTAMASGGRDFSGVPVKAAKPSAATGAIAEIDPIHFQSGPAKTPAPAKPASTPAVALSVDKIDIVDSATGAIGGYPAITSGDLNAPGPFNSTATGGVNNVHQIHVHLDNGSSASLTPTRIVRGSNWLNGVELKHPADQVMPAGEAGPPKAGGFGGVMDAPDGPAAHEIKRPTTDKLVVADAPGIGRLAASHYPYVHKSTFSLTVSASSGAAIASIRYGVRISKKTATDIPNTENAITSIEKKDLVRGKAL